MALALARNLDGAAVPEAAPYCIVELPGDPRGKGDTKSRTVFSKRLNRMITIRYLDEQTRQYMDNLRAVARVVMRAKPPLHGAVCVGVLATMRVPRSWSERDRAQALTGVIVPTAKPDWDNLAKMLDAFKGVVWGDDASVAQGMVIKQYGERPSLRVEVFRLLPRAPLFA